MKFLIITLALTLIGTVALGQSTTTTTTTTKKTRRHVAATQEVDDSGSSSYSTRGSSSPSGITVQRIQPQVGLTIADITSKSTSSRTGFQTGIAADMLGNGNLVLETGLFYKQEGTASGNTTVALNYLVIPISAKYYFMGQRGNTVYGKGGLAPAFNVSHTISSNDGGQSTDLAGVNTLELSAILGLGGKIALSPNTGLFLEADYNRGLTNVISTSDLSVNNVGFGFSTGVSIDM